MTEGTKGSTKPAKKLTFTLGDREFTIGRLNIGQLEDLQDLLLQKASVSSLTVLSIALRKDYPELGTKEAVGNLEADDTQQRATAVSLILVHAGYVPSKKPGEAQAAPPQTADGAASTSVELSPE